MKVNKSSSFIVMLFGLLFFTTSCLKNEDNVQSYNYMIGSVVTITGQNFFRLDSDGSLLLSTDFSKYVNGSRILASFKINYSQQPSGTHNYYVVQDVVSASFALKQTFNIDVAEKDTFENDPIAGFLAYFTNFDGRVLFTTSSSFNSSTLTHSINLVKNSVLASVSASDTLKLEVRHNKKGDAETTKKSGQLVSFDLSPYLSDVPYGGYKWVEISYNLSDKITKYVVKYSPQYALD